MLLDQAERLRRLAEDLKADIRNQGAVPGRAPWGPRVIAVTSGKGGVGKTSIAVNLGLALRQLGHEVLIIDADLGLANVDVVLGTNPALHLGHVVRGEKRIEDVIYTGPGGLKLIAAGSGLQELLDVEEPELARFVHALQELEREADFVLIDTSAGLTRQVTAFVLAADEILVVTNPEPTAMTDAYAVIKIITRHRPGANIRLILNEVDNEEDAEVAINRISMAALRFLGVQIDSLGHVPSDLTVPRAIKQQQPFLLSYPGGAAARAVRELAARLSGTSDEQEYDKGFFFRRLARFFSRMRA